MKHTDPVCGMQVEDTAPLKSQYNGKTIYFCSPGCKSKFDKNPAQYSSKIK
jgi:P-type Cu+ transporter